MKKERKVDGTTNKAFNKMPSPSLLEWRRTQEMSSHQRGPMPGGPGGRKWRTLGKQPAAWSLAPWAAQFPRRRSWPCLSFPCQHHSFTPSPEPLPRISRITEFFKCTTYSLKHMLERSSRNPKVSSLNKNNRKKTEITTSREKNNRKKFLTLNSDTDSENITKNIIQILLKT